MFGKNKKYRQSQNSFTPRGTHSSRRTRGSHSRNNAWTSSVVGTHANPTSSRRSARGAQRPASQRSSARNLERRTSEINQMGLHTHSVDERTARHKTGKSRTEGFMRRNTAYNRILVIVLIVAVVGIAFGIGSCVFRSSLSSSMALNDDSVSQQLVAPESSSDPCNIMLVGISDDGTSKEAASFIAVMRVDPGSKVISLLNIPSNLATTYADSDDDMLRDAPHAADEGELVSQVSDLIEGDINHYVRITDEGFSELVDSLGGLTITVDQMVDDPTVGHIVIDPGEQTLNGAQALTYVSAKNYTNGFETRSDIQSKVLLALASALKEKGGVDFAMSADSVASKIGTDMDYDTLCSIADVFGDATIYTATMPGSQYLSGNSTYWSKSSDSWEKLLKQYAAGEELDISTDTSGVDKGGLTITVLNGGGNDGYASKMAEELTAKGYTIEETGNASQNVYDETLVIYSTPEFQAAAEAIVQDLGQGRAVDASIYYTLETDIEVIIGKDWSPS